MTLLLRKQKINRMYYFILHLSIADLLVAFLNILPQMIWDITWRFQGNDFLCKSVKFFQVFSMYLSAWILVMMAFDRHYAIVYPLNAYSWRARRCTIMICTAWILSALCSLPQIFVFSQREILPGIEDCWASFIEPWGSKLYVTWFAFSIYLIPLVILTITYSQVTRTVWKVIRLKENGTLKIKPDGRTKIVNRSCVQSVIHSGSQSIRRSRTTQSTYRRVYNRTKLLTVKLTAVVVATYIICWSPFIFSLLWTTFFPDSGSLNKSAFVILLLMANLNSCTNPWIYLYFSLRKYVRCKDGWKWSLRPKLSRTASRASDNEDQEPRITEHSKTENETHYIHMPPEEKRMSVFGIPLHGRDLFTGEYAVAL
ncbi:hypothetical protein RvY_00939-1 [Ramazzottius varieornatus]|uniref:G-protein coupled receptors family 1 profile domain-containing protein n=1 Tax=Ramazzottius varieornatus TaxID=947166 RepID=A0A1D1UIJ7_RAMVA|nr:hypothetical protein RvY_00939-1 [Ramazzottius varieornatus]